MSRTIMLQFHIVKSTSKYNVMLHRQALQKLSMEVSMIRSLVKFPTRARVAQVKGDYADRDASLATAVKESNIREITANPKIQAVLHMNPPKNLTELQSLNRKLAALSQFLSRASENSYRSSRSWSSVL
ncbi:hypothetical protein Tco_0877661 [Tanacetum coccineum]|uniref:Uncharacterized protein n=1 Tax=Tanacetum coccineum TaxID=301880 RepID=A0ABQ5BVP4_9ASTR